MPLLALEFFPLGGGAQLRMRPIPSQGMFREIKCDRDTTHVAKNLKPGGKNRRS
jgi:hypothetical protein